MNFYHFIEILQKLFDAENPIYVSFCFWATYSVKLSGGRHEEVRVSVYLKSICMSFSASSFHGVLDFPRSFWHEHGRWSVKKSPSALCIGSGPQPLKAALHCVPEYCMNSTSDLQPSDFHLRLRLTALLRTACRPRKRTEQAVRTRHRAIQCSQKECVALCNGKYL